jgi:hypothetical protein
VRFEVRYSTGAQHEIELSGTVAVLGRDPASDLVLNDAKCSRRHAVIEAGPDGIAIRDAGSANGIFVNGRKVERAQLAVGDVVRLGEVTLKVLPEDVSGTLVMAPEDVDDLGGTRPADAVPPGLSRSPAPPPGPLAAVPSAASKVPPVPVAAPPGPKAPAVPPPPLPKVGDRPAGGSGKTLIVVGVLGCLLLLVLTVVAILAAIFIPSYLRSRTTGQDEVRPPGVRTSRNVRLTGEPSGSASGK